MAIDFFNPLFSEPGAFASDLLGGGALGQAAQGLVGNAVAPLVSSFQGNIRQALSPFTGNPVVNTVVGTVLGNLPAKGPLAAARGRPDPLWAQNFEAQFTGGPSSPLSSAYIEEADLPWYHFDRLAHYRGGKNYYYPGDFDLSQFTMKFYEDRQLNTLRFLTSWKSLIRNADNTVNMPKAYKRNLSISILDDRRQIVGNALVIGCWPISFSPVSFRSDTSERVVMTAEMSADDVTIQFGGGVSAANASGASKGLADLVGQFGSGVGQLGKGLDLLNGSLNGTLTNLAGQVGSALGDLGSLGTGSIPGLNTNGFALASSVIGVPSDLGQFL